MIFMNKKPSVIVNCDSDILEKRVLSEIPLTYHPQDQVVLIREHDKEMGIHRVDVAMPWRTVYNISKHNTRVDAQIAFEGYDNKLKHGPYKIRLTGPATAEIIEVKK